jgi:hypothetical protein
MPHPFSLSDQVNLAQARGSLSAFLSMHFLNMPDEAFLEHVRSEAVLGFLAQLAEEDASHPDLTRGHNRCSHIWRPVCIRAALL